ncbi:Com family DNA-binding transcriptional regulator [Clostridium sp. Marseille-P299]|uniref:Com family DNA-binding transcriptional regulator n=1 Tax=Clostridium sp. Marseille-P299 TaxID=1805477 RepID=UPI000836FB2B|nr:Com family DNA-binding transcriptional regulator [Clostridium sp. Marseille-P299]
MIDFRCKKCDRKLAETDGNTSIKCPRCGNINVLNIKTKEIKTTPCKKIEPERKTSSGKRFY